MKQTLVAGAPSPTLAVIGAGPGRTGTLSLHAALERLGFTACEHMTNCFANRSNSPTGWRRPDANEPVSRSTDDRSYGAVQVAPIVELTWSGKELATLTADLMPRRCTSVGPIKMRCKLLACSVDVGS
jgi:hypothetical protein